MLGLLPRMMSLRGWALSPQAFSCYTLRSDGVCKASICIIISFHRSTNCNLTFYIIPCVDHVFKMSVNLECQCWNTAWCIILCVYTCVLSFVILVTMLGDQPQSIPIKTPSFNWDSVNLHEQWQLFSEQCKFLLINDGPFSKHSELACIAAVWIA